MRQLPHHQVHERAALDAVLDAGRVCHVGLVSAGGPVVVPLAYGRDGDRLVVHGSTGSRAFRALADGAPACVTVTLLDGLVLARSAFETSMQYRSAVVLGTFETVVGAERTLAALACLSEHSAPGRWVDVRPPTRRELAATRVLQMPLVEWSVKVSDGWPEDDAADLDLPVWAGVVPFVTSTGAPAPAPDLRPGVEPASYLAAIPPPGRPR